jgi:hypothetical protein
MRQHHVISLYPRTATSKIEMLPHLTRPTQIKRFKYWECPLAYDAGDLYDWSTLNTPTSGRPSSIINDFEDWDCQRNKNAKADHSKDWSNPGMQHKTLDKYDD